jgi:hypothetical protein
MKTIRKPHPRHEEMSKALAEAYKTQRRVWPEFICCKVTHEVIPRIYNRQTPCEPR